MMTTNRTGYSKGREGGNMRKTGKGIAISLSLAAFVIAGMLAVGGTAYGSTGIFWLRSTRLYAHSRDGAGRLQHLPHLGTCFQPLREAIYAPGGARRRRIGNHAIQCDAGGNDSDGDTFTNLAEIMALTFPGDNTSFPAAVDNTAPTVDSTFRPTTRLTCRSTPWSSPGSASRSTPRP